MNIPQLTSEIVSAWAVGTAVLSVFNRVVIRGRLPRVASAIAAICAVSPGDAAQAFEEIAALFSQPAPASEEKKSS